MYSDLVKSVVELDRDKVLEIVRNKIKEGGDLFAVIDDCRQGLSEVGKRFEKGEYFLAELLLSAKLLESVIAMITPYLTEARKSNVLGKVLLVTPKGDIHDLGKNILRSLLEAEGFEVYDLGVDVEPQLILQKTKEVKPDVVGFSCLLTNVFNTIKETIGMITDAGVRDDLKIIIGGGATNTATKDFVKADFQTTNAMEGLKYCVDYCFSKGGRKTL